MKRRLLLLLMLVVLAWTGDALAFTGGSRLSGPAPGVANRTPAGRVGAGNRFSCALRPDGFVRCWGRNTSGQLGDGTTIDRLTPVAVSGLANAIDITVGIAHACAVLADGTVRCWGNNSQGRLGDGTTIDRTTPVAVTGLSGVVGVSSSFHNCALLNNGTVRCWGSNGIGQLGDGTSTARPTPVQVVGLNDVVSVSTGNSHTCAVRADGTAWCWGRNDFGHLGNGTTSPFETTPQQVGGIINGVAITAGSEHACALLANGSVQCWGVNNAGQLGDGTQTNRSLPVAVGDLGTNAVAVSTGNGHSCALLADGSARCWGTNPQGQLGNGTTTVRTTPVQVVNLANAIAIGAGSGHTCALRRTEPPAAGATETKAGSATARRPTERLP